MSLRNLNAISATPAQDRLVSQVISTLDDELADLDTNTIRRLNQSRHQALDRLHKRSWSSSLQNTYPNMLSACASTMAVFFMVATFMPANVAPSLEQSVGVAHSEIPDMLGEEDLDFYKSIDFLLWLEQQSV